MTFRSLYRLESRGSPRLPDRRRRVRRLDARSTRPARARLDRGGPATRSTTTSSSGSPGASRTSTATSRTPPRTSGSRRRSRGGPPGLLPRDPPSLFGMVVGGLAKAGLTENARVVVEKPFGHDLASARALNAELHALIDESQLYRIDHFLGKLSVEDILYLRFANSSSSQSGTGSSSRRCRSRWARTSTSRAAATSTTRSARCGTSSRTTFCRYSATSPWRLRRDMVSTSSTTASETSSWPWRKPTRRTTYAASTTAISTSQASRRTHRQRPFARFVSRSTTGGGPVSHSSSAPGRPCR